MPALNKGMKQLLVESIEVLLTRKFLQVPLQMLFPNVDVFYEDNQNNPEFVD